jgi:hypothetical protein
MEGKMTKLVPENLTFSEVGHLPIVKDFAKKIKLVETLNAMVDSEMELSPGIAVLAMVLDTLSGRTPLYRLEEFFQEKDTDLILGHAVKPELFCDYNVGRVLDNSVTSGKAGGMYCEPLKAVVKTISHLKVADYSNRPSWSMRLSKVSWFRMYSRTASSSRPAVAA